MSVAEDRSSLEIVEIRGVKAPLDPSIMSETMMAVIRSGAYEGREAEKLPELVEEGERIVEIGGGIGYLSALVGKLGRAASIAVIEANPQLIPIIEHTHALNGVSAVVRHAVVAPVKTAPTLPFYLHQEFWASSLIPVKKRHRVGVVQTPVISIAEMLEDHAPTLLIIDIEGGEVDLLEGARLDGVQKILMEVHFKVIGFAGMKLVFDRLSEQGFAYDARHSAQAVVVFQRVAD